MIICPHLAPADATRLCALPCRTAARGDRVASPDPPAWAIALSAAASHPSRPPALGLDLPCLERVASGARHGQTRDGHRVATPRLPPMLDVEEPSPHRSSAVPDSRVDCYRPAFLSPCRSRRSRRAQAPALIKAIFRQCAGLGARIALGRRSRVRGLQR